MKSPTKSTWEVDLTKYVQEPTPTHPEHYPPSSRTDDEIDPRKPPASAETSDNTAIILVTAFLDVLKHCTSLAPSEQDSFLEQLRDSLSTYHAEISTTSACPVVGSRCIDSPTTNVTENGTDRKAITEAAIALGKERLMLEVCSFIQHFSA
jgi:hypothetical protein